MHPSATIHRLAPWALAASALFSLVAPAQAAVLPQGSSIKVLDESQHAEYLHSVLPRTGEGRVMLTLEVNQVRTPAGEHVDIVEVLHQRQVVRRALRWI